MTAGSRWFFSLVAYTLVMTPAAIRAADWRDLLKLPISPGSIAILVEHPREPAVVARWQAALDDRDARVRAAAARVSNVTIARELAAALEAALERETDDEAALEEVRAVAAVRDMSMHDAVRVARALSDEQREAIERAGVRRTMWSGPRAHTGGPPLMQYIRSIGDLPTGLFGSLMSAGRCPGGAERILAGAEITYDATGRARNINFLAPLSPGFAFAKKFAEACEQAARAALVVALDSDWVDAGTPQLVLADTDPEIVACVDGAWDADAGVRVGGNVRQPQKIRDVKPFYPLGAASGRIQGLVIEEAVVSSAGCVRAVRILRNPDVRLSISGLYSVMGWRFSPPLADGRPVPILITVTTNFTLK